MPDTLRVKTPNIEHTVFFLKTGFFKKKILKALKVQKTKIQELQYPSKLNTNHNCYWMSFHFLHELTGLFWWTIFWTPLPIFLFKVE